MNPKPVRHALPGWRATEGAVTSNWKPMGPSVYSRSAIGYNPGIGRLTCVVRHPRDSGKLFVGTPSSGIWASSDGGKSWSTTTDNLLNQTLLGVSGIVIHPTTPDTMYASTGDGFGAHSNFIGVIKSTDGGKRWANTNFSLTPANGYYSWRLVMSPSDPDTLIVATNGGLFRTTDGGANWTNQQPESVTRFCDIEYKPGDGNTVFAAAKGSGSHILFKSNDGGANWSALSGGVIPAANQVGRTALAVSGSRLYLLCTDTSGGFYGIYSSDDDAASFTQRATAASAGNLINYIVTQGTQMQGGQGDYDLAFAADPTNPARIFLGGTLFWTSADSGANWTRKSWWTHAANRDSSDPKEAHLHADHHYIDITDGNNFYLCHDGGLAKTTDGGTTWQDLSNGLAISQFYRIGSTPNAPGMFLCGAQDNGMFRYEGGQWTYVWGGDAMECLPVANNPNAMLMAFNEGGLNRFEGNNLKQLLSDGTTGEGAEWVAPFIIHPTQPSTYYIGSYNLWRSTDNGDSFSKAVNFDSTEALRWLAMSPADTNLIYMVRGNAVQRYNATTNSVSNLGNGLPSVSIPQGPVRNTSIAVSPTNAQHLWVTLSSYSSGNKVFSSTDGGANFANFSGTLPNVPINCILYENGSNNGLYIGTDVGIFYRNAAMTDWSAFGTNLPNTIIADLDIDYTNKKIRAATFGRGVWESDLAGATPASPVAPSITAQPAAVTITKGEAATLSVAANGSAPLSYQWYLGTSGTVSDPVTGETAASINTGALNATTTYWVRVTNGKGSADSTSTTVTANDPPTITDVQNQTLNDDQTKEVQVETTDSETSGESVQVEAKSSNPSLIPNPFVAVGTGGNRTLTLDPVNGKSGRATITITAKDSSGAVSKDTFDVHVVDATPSDSTELFSADDPFGTPDTFIGVAPYAASIYPVEIPVSGVTGTVSSISISLKGAHHAFPDQLDILLVGPTGAAVILMSDCGGNNSISGRDLTFTDAGSSLTTSAITTGQYQPTNLGSGTDTFPAPAPATTPATSLATFAGKNPNGVWKLYVVDDTPLDGGGFDNVLLEITTTGGDSNAPPTITDIQDQNITTGSNTGTLAFTVADTTTAAASLTVTATSSNTTLVPTSGLVLGGSGANRTLTVTPTAGAQGEATITVRVADASGVSDEDTFTLAVNPATLAITAQPAPVTITTYQSANLDCTFSGTGPFTVQWFKGTSGDISTPASQTIILSGTNTISFNTGPLTDTTSYWVQVSAGDSLLKSTTATVTVNANGSTAFPNDNGVITMPSATIGAGDISLTANPYPSDLTVSGVTQTIKKVTVSLNGLEHEMPNALNLLLVSPGGTAVLLMSNTGYNPVSDVDFSFDDKALDDLEDGTIANGASYRPTVGAGSSVSFDAPAPDGPYSSALSSFNGEDADGVWKLYILDDSADIREADATLRGWSLRITTVDVSTPIALWKTNYFGNATASDTADTDKDGVWDLLEYAFNADPNTPSSDALPDVAAETGYVCLTYTRLIDSTGITYTIEESTNLTNWSEASVTEEIISQTSTTQTIKARVPTANNTMKFLRITVTNNQ